MEISDETRDLEHVLILGGMLNAARADTWCPFQVRGTLLDNITALSQIERNLKLPRLRQYNHSGLKLWTTNTIPNVSKSILSGDWRCPISNSGCRV
jgi:hypothetical protein